MIPHDRLIKCCRALRDVVVQYYATEGLDLPSRRYVSPGVPAWDCDQFVVYVERNTSGTVNAEDTSAIDCLVVRSATIVAEIARCVPKVEQAGDQVVVPTPEEEEAAAELVLTDPMALVNAAVQGYRDGSLAGCKGLAVVEWEALGPDGGFAGGRQRFRWQLTDVGLGAGLG